jgi:hypothetical protein
MVNVQLSRLAIDQQMMLGEALVGAWTLVSYTERSLPDGRAAVNRHWLPTPWRKRSSGIVTPDVHEPRTLPR